MKNTWKKSTFWSTYLSVRMKNSNSRVHIGIKSTTIDKISFNVLPGPKTNILLTVLTLQRNISKSGNINDKKFIKNIHSYFLTISLMTV